MVKIAIIGAGGYAYHLIKRAVELPEKLKLVAVYSNPARDSAGRTFCMEKGIEVLPDIDGLLEYLSGKADVILVPTPINTHAKLSKKCIEAGFAVWLEKPPVATIQEHDELQKFAESKGKCIAVMFQNLYSDIVQTIKADISAGRFGQVKRIKSMACWQRLDDYYGRSNWAGKIRVDGDWVLDGTVNNPLAHMLANELYFASMQPGKMAEPAKVQAELYRGHCIESEDTSSVRIETADKVEILFNASLCSESQTGPLTTIECTKATIEYSNFNEALITLENGKTQRITVNGDQRINMLEKLADSFENKNYLVPLDMCRPFTIAVNGAFESCGTVHAVEEKYLRKYDHGDSIKTVIKGIDHLLRTAHDNAKLFSEVSTPWSKSSKIIEMNGYKKFPSFGFRC
ncbi:MAG: Gfo/Idh/MocA family oxidoreductase [Phycisphaerae bacterium]